MTEEQLQALSRQATGCLQEEVRKNLRAYKGCVDIGPKNALPIWLHESTEACTEIMVLVLWPMGCHIRGSARWSCWKEPFKADTFSFEDCNNDPMLAFRVAVLYALICLKGKP